MKYCFVIVALLALSANAFAFPAGLDAKKINAGDLAELRKAFAVRDQQDGGEAEDLDIAIGKSIDRRPQNFLTALKEYKEAKHGIVGLDSLVGNLGEDYVDKMKKQDYAVTKRMKTLRKVTIKALMPLRDECVALLAKKKKQIEADESLKAH